LLELEPSTAEFRLIGILVDTLIKITANSYTYQRRCNEMDFYTSPFLTSSESLDAAADRTQN